MTASFSVRTSSILTGNEDLLGISEQCHCPERHLKSNELCVDHPVVDNIQRPTKAEEANVNIVSVTYVLGCTVLRTKEVSQTRLPNHKDMKDVEQYV